MQRAPARAPKGPGVWGRLRPHRDSVNSRAAIGFKDKLGTGRHLLSDRPEARILPDSVEQRAALEPGEVDEARVNAAAKRCDGSVNVVDEGAAFCLELEHERAAPGVALGRRGEHHALA